MSFVQHRSNLIEWIYFARAESGLEQAASVLLLGDPEELRPFQELLEKRVRSVSVQMLDGKYDYIVIPYLEKRVLHLFGGKPERMLTVLSEEHLNPGGELVLGIANRHEPERLVSGIYEERLSYLSYAELAALRESLRQRFPNSSESLYFPMPSLELPLHLYSLDRLPLPGEEDTATDALLSAGSFPAFAPAYLYRFRPVQPKLVHDWGFRSWKPLYMKYNSSRREEFRIKTEILRDEKGMRHVLKESLSPMANAHIEALPERAAMLAAANPQLRVLREEKQRTASGGCASVLYPYIDGKSVGELLAERIQDGAAPLTELTETMRLLLGKEEGELSPANLDCLFENVLLQDGVPMLIDCEWVTAEKTSAEFLRYRMLRYWYERYRSRLAYPELSDFLRLFGFRSASIRSCAAQEESLQSGIHGEGEAGNVWAYRQSQISVKNFERQKTELRHSIEVIEELKRELSERDITIRKEREVQRLTNIHVGNLEKVIETHETDISSLQRDLAYYQAHQSLSSRIRCRIREGYNRRFPLGSRKRKRMGYVLRTLRHPLRMLPMYFTASGRNRIRGDFRIGEDYLREGMLCFERQEQPLVSIVIPCYNQIGYTYRCLSSILRHTDQTETPYEVIIADDVSTDATRDLREYTKNLVIARNTENMGFLRNCNQAAALARGEYIFFLNNDTTVSEGWLRPLTVLLQQDATIGMAGSKLVYPDGRLQEAGGIIWSDASGWNYGRLQDPMDPEYNYVKEVDYISGAAILIRRRLWKELGGFDERFAPAYCEDSDLAFSVRKLGYRVVYQPQSVVTHYEGISNGTDVNGTGLKRYQLLNQEKFREKWREELRQQYVNDGSPNPFKARERGRDKRYILVVDHYVPTWDRDAGSKTTFQYLQMFVRMGYRVKFLGDNFLSEQPYTGVLQQMGIEVLCGQKMQADIWGWIERNRDMIDIAYLNRPHITAKYIDFIREHTDWKCIFYGHDLHFLREMREYALTKDPAVLEDAEYWRGVELSVMKKVDISYYPSEIEVDAIREIDPSIRVKAITAYIFPEAAARRTDYAKKEGLLFVGGFAHPPNKDGVLWFAREIFPEIRRQIPDIVFRIVGSKADSEVKALSEQEGIEVLGFVSDERLSELYQEARLVVVPLRYGAGVKGKVVEALHEGAAILTTSCGAEGIPGVEQALMIADQEKAFAETAVRLYHDLPARKRLSEQAAAFVKEHFSVEGAWSRIADDFSA